MTRSVAITFIVFISVAIITLLSKTYAFLGFWWSDNWNNNSSISSFIPANSIDQSSVMLAQSSMNMLWQIATVTSDRVSGESSNSNNSNTRTLEHSTTLISYDLIAAVQSSIDASATITNHINDLNQATTQLTQQLSIYQSQIEQSQSKLTDCSSDKKIADAAVIEAVNTNNLQQIYNLIQTSVTAGQCETQHRVTINALTLVTKKYSQAIASLTKKANFIEQHKTVIAQYPEIIADPAIIKELSQISSQF